MSTYPLYTSGPCHWYKYHSAQCRTMLIDSSAGTAGIEHADYTGHPTICLLPSENETPVTAQAFAAAHARVLRRLALLAEGKDDTHLERRFDFRAALEAQRLSFQHQGKTLSERIDAEYGKPLSIGVNMNPEPW